MHPLGKSPVISDDGEVVAESAAIIEYLVETYGHLAGAELAGLQPALATPIMYVLPSVWQQRQHPTQLDPPPA